jgi:ribosomal protein S3AE
MADEQKKPQVVLKKKKKKWVSIYGLKDFKDVQLGESYVSDSNLLMNREIEVNLMEITNDVKKQNINVKFKISNVTDNKATADFIGYEIIGSMIRRVVRRSRSKIDDSFIVETKDNIKINIKPIILTKSKVPHSLLTKLRATAREFLIAGFKKYPYDEVVMQLINQDIQKSLREVLKKIMPVSVVEIRMFKKLKN